MHSVLIMQKRVWVQFLHHILSMKQNCFLCYIILADKISLSNCLSFLRQSAIYVLQLLVSQIVASYIFKLSSCFSTLLQIQDKNINILRTKGAFKVKKHFPYCPRPESAPLTITPWRHFYVLNMCCLNMFYVLNMFCRLTNDTKQTE